MSTVQRHKVGAPLVFDDHPEFRPNLTPCEIFQLGSFGGTYWRPIHSAITNRNYKNQHKEFSDLQTIDENLLTRPIEDVSLNRYKVHSGSTLLYWEEHGWIKKQDPYGWVQWYCRFYSGRRSKDDDRQIKRWLAFAGPSGRFRLALRNKIKKKKTSVNDYTVSPAIRQGLQHWAYILTK